MLGVRVLGHMENMLQFKHSSVGVQHKLSC